MHIRLQTLTILLLSLLSFLSFGQQTANINGKITTSDGQPASYISIGLKSSNHYTSSDVNGAYNLSRIKPGTYVLEVRGVGINPQEKTVVLLAGETAKVSLF